MRKPRTPPNPFEILEARKGDLSGLNNPLTQDFARQCENAYWHWNTVKMAAPTLVDAELVWAMVKMGRVARAHRLPLFGAEGLRLQFNVPDYVQRELMLIDQQLAGQLAADDDTPLTEHQKERFIISALREEAIASSMLEGAITTRRDAKILLKSGRKPKTRGERMVVNNYHAIQFARDNRRMPLTREFLLELQTTLTRDTLDDPSMTGRFRTEGDDITVVDARDNEIMHQPPPAPELDTRLGQLCDFVNKKDKRFIHPVIKACVVHFQLGFDHPFCDGNGRTARVIFYWMMLKAGYWLFEYLPISQLIYHGPSKYQKAFLYCETDDFDVTHFLMYKARIIGRARQALQQYIGKKQRDLTQARKLLSSDRRLNHRQQQVVLQAVKHPGRVFTIADHQSTHAVSYGTARSDLLDLVGWDYLKQEVVGNRYDFYPSQRIANGADGN